MAAVHFHDLGLKKFNAKKSSINLGIFNKLPSNFQPYKLYVWKYMEFCLMWDRNARLAIKTVLPNAVLNSGFEHAVLCKYNFRNILYFVLICLHLFLKVSEINSNLTVYSTNINSRIYRCDQNWAFHSLAALNLAVIIELRLIWAALNLAYHNSALA